MYSQGMIAKLAGPDRRIYTAGLAGLTWFALLIVTNIMNATVAPAADADVDEVVAHLTDDRAIIIAVTSGFVLSIPLVFWFISGLAEVLRSHGRQQAAFAGIVGFAGVLTLFGLVSTTRLSLMTAVETDSVDDSTVWAMWKLHDVAFMVNGAAIGTVLLAVGLGGVAVGLLPRWIKPVAIIGGAALILSAVVFTVPVAEGSTAAMTPGLVGFLLWLLFVVTSSVCLMRRGATSA